MPARGGALSPPGRRSRSAACASSSRRRVRPSAWTASRRSSGGLLLRRATRYPERVVRQIYSGRIVDLRVERVTLPNGTAVDLELMHHPGASAVVAVDEAGAVVLIRQYRHAAGGYIWELPAGVLDSPGEPPEQCARRELREETGLEARDVVRLGTIFTTPGFCDE